MPFRGSAINPTKVPTQRVRLNRSHPLGNKLISALIPGISGMTDLSGYGNSPVLSVGSHSYPSCPIVSTSMGPAIHVLNDAWIWSNPTIPTVSGDFTVYWINYENSAESPLYGTQFSSRQPVDTSFDMGFYAVGGLHGDVGDGSSWINTNVNGSSSLVFDNVPTHYAVTIQSGVAGWVYVQGQAAGGAGLGGGTALLWDSTHIFQMGSDSTYGLHGRLPFIGIWNRALSAGEIAQMYAEPFAMFQPVVRKQYYSLQATGGAGAVLAASPSGTSSVSAVLSTSIKLASASAATSVSTASLAIPSANLASSLAAVASATSDLSTSIRLASGLTSVSASTSDLTTSTPLVPAGAVVGYSTGTGGGTYPLNYNSQTYDATGCSALVVFCYAFSSGVSVPTCSYGSQTCTWVGTQGGSSATCWAWYLDAPTTGSHTLTISLAGTYVGPLVCYAVGLSGTATAPSIGGSNFPSNGNPTVATISSLVGASSLIIGFGGGYYSSGISSGSDVPAATTVASLTTANQPTMVTSQVGGSAGSSATVAYRNTTSNSNATYGFLVEIQTAGVSGGPSAVLVSALTAVSTSTANILTAIQLAASASSSATSTSVFAAPVAALVASLQSVANETSDLTTQIRLLSSSVSLAGSTANLSTSVRLAVSVVAASTISSALTTQVKLVSSSASLAGSTANLSTSVRLAVSLTAVSTTLGALTTLAGSLGCATQSISAITASLSTQIKLISSSVSSAVSTESLTTAIRLSASVVGTSVVSSALTTQIRLASALSNIASVSSALTTTAGSLGSNFQAVTSATADLTTAIRLSASLVGVASSNTNLTSTIDLVSNVSTVITNYIRNPRGEGAVAGTPGTNPSLGWSLLSAGGISKQIVGTGTVNGIQYVDVRMFGTVTTAAQLYVNFSFDSGIPAKYRQTWTGSLYVQLLNDSSTYITSNFAIFFVQTAPSTNYLGGSNIPAATLAASFSRISQTMTTTNIQMTNIGLSFWSTGASSTLGNTVDITFRLGYPQLEWNAFLSPVILPPIGSPGISFLAANANADLSTQISLSASVSAVSSATNSLTSGIRLAANPSGSASVSAALAGGASQFGANPTGSASASASLTTAIRLITAPQVVSTVSAALSSNSLIAANIQDTASVSAAITTAIRLVSASQVASSASATITPTSATLQAPVAASSSTTCNLSTQIKMASTALCAASSTASMRTNSLLFASLVTSSSLSGNLRTNSLLFANCVSVAQAAASMIALQIVAGRGKVVRKEDRIISPETASRIKTIHAEKRYLSVAAKSRVHVIRFEARTFIPKR